MGIGQRLSQLFGGGPRADADPGAMTEVARVQLVEGPLLVERLRDRGVEAAGIESVDPVTGVRSYMRIMVRQADVPAATQAIEEGSDEASAGAALDNLAAAKGDEEDEAAEEAAQQAMSELYLTADRLMGQPDDVQLVAEIDDLRGAVAGSIPPFGVEPLAWKRVATLAAAVVDADEAGEEEGVRAAAQSLREFLREYV